MRTLGLVLAFGLTLLATPVATANSSAQVKSADNTAQLCRNYSGLPAAKRSEKNADPSVPPGMVAIRGGRFLMGSERFYP